MEEDSVLPPRAPSSESLQPTAVSEGNIGDAGPGSSGEKTAAEARALGTADSSWPHTDTRESPPESRGVVPSQQCLPLSWLQPGRASCVCYFGSHFRVVLHCLLGLPTR